MANNVIISVPVSSVNGETGIVVLDATSVGAAETTHTHTESDITDLGTYLTDAPIDGEQYSRQDGAWAQVTTGGTGDMVASVYDPGDSASDVYARANHTGTQSVATIIDFDTEVTNNAAVVLNTAKVTFPESDLDGYYYGRNLGAWSRVTEEAPIDGNSYTRYNGSWSEVVSDNEGTQEEEVTISVPSGITEWSTIAALLPDDGDLGDRSYTLEFDAGYSYTFTEPMDFSAYYNGEIIVSRVVKSAGSSGTLNIDLGTNPDVHAGFILLPKRNADFTFKYDYLYCTCEAEGRPVFVGYKTENSALTKVSTSKNVNLNLSYFTLYYTDDSTSGYVRLVSVESYFGDIHIVGCSLQMLSTGLLFQIVGEITNANSLSRNNGIRSIVIRSNTASSSSVYSSPVSMGSHSILYYGSNTNFASIPSSNTYVTTVEPY